MLFFYYFFTTVKPSNLTMKQILKEIRSKKETKTTQCKKFKTQIEEHCLNKFYELIYDKQSPEITNDDDDADDDHKFIGSALLMKQTCCTFTKVYIQCIVSYVHMICPIKDFQMIYNENLGLYKLCQKYFEDSEECDY